MQGNAMIQVLHTLFQTDSLTVTKVHPLNSRLFPLMGEAQTFFFFNIWPSFRILTSRQASVITAKMAARFPLSGGSHWLSGTLTLTWSSFKFSSFPHAILILMHLITEIEKGSEGKEEMGICAISMK